MKVDVKYQSSIESINLSLTVHDAEFLLWLTGKCNGMDTPACKLYNELSKIKGLKARVEGFETIQLVKTSWSK